MDIFGDVTFTEITQALPMWVRMGCLCSRKRRNGEPYRLIIVVNERGGPVQVSGKDVRDRMSGGGGPFYVYAEGGTFDLGQGNGSARNLAVQDADLILSGELNRLETDHPDVAQWLRGGLEQVVPYFLRREEPSEAGTEKSTSYQSSDIAYLATGGYYSIFETSSPQPSASLLPPSQTISGHLDLSGALTFDLWGGLHYLAHGLITDSDAVSFVQDATQNYAEHLDATSYSLMLRLAGALETDSAKADALVAVAGVLPEDAGLRAEYRRVALTLEDEALQRKALDALVSPQGSTGLEVVLDAAHGGALGGASGYADEDEVVLAVAQKVAARLAAAGVRVVMTREGDAALGDTLAEDLDARLAHVTPDTDAFVSLHANASEDSLTQGTETFVANDFETDELEAATLELAGELQTELVGADAPNVGA